MEINRDNIVNSPSTAPVDRESTVFDRESTTLDRSMAMSEPVRSGSNFMAFLIGGLVIAVGLLAFLFYDSGNSGREVNTTGSTAPRIQAPASPAAPATPTTPASPATPQ